MEAISRLVHDYDVSMAGFSDFARDDLHELLSEEHFEIERDSCLVVDDEDRAAGYAMVWAREPRRRYLSFGVVHPEHRGRGIGTHLLGFLERRVREQDVDTAGAVLWNWVDLEDEAACRIAEAAGFAQIRRHYTMMIDLVGTEVETSPPEGVSTRTCDESDAELIHSLLQETFAEHFGFTPLRYEQWRKQSYERSDTDLSMWLIASVGGKPVGFLIGRAKDDLGWVEDLGVKKAFRKRGVASALLRHSFADFRKRGFSKAGLGVDASNETGAVRLYENAGMRAERVYVTYEKLYRR